MRNVRPALSLVLLAAAVLAPPRAAHAGGDGRARQLLANQPDFVAEETISDFEPHIGAGFSASARVAKKGDTYRADNGTFIFFFKHNRPALRLYVKGKTYEEMPLTDNKRFVWHIYANHVAIFARSERVKFEIARESDEYVVIKATTPEPGRGEEAVYFYAAKRMKNLVTRIELATPGRSTTWALSDISFDVAAGLFEIPPGYKREGA